MRAGISSRTPAHSWVMSRRGVAVPVHGPRPRRLPARLLRGDGQGVVVAKIAAGSPLVEALVWRREAEQARRPGEGGARVEALVAKVEAWIGAVADRARNDPRHAIPRQCKLVAHSSLKSLRHFTKVPCRRRRIRLMGVL
jgi:hypothetical protein